MTKGVLFRVFARSFFIQASWNFERMQNLGFCYAILPVLKRLYSGEELKNAIKRHLEFFNTHPYMSTTILGVASDMEESLKEGRLQGGDIASMKTSVMGPYGALGDSFFWGALKPFASILAVCFAMMNCVFAAAIFLIIFNVPHLFMRIYGFRVACLYGAEVFDRVGRIGLADMAGRIKAFALLVLGAALALSAGKARVFFDAESYLWPVFFTVLIFLFLVEALKKGFSPHTIFYLLVAFSIATATLV